MIKYLTEIECSSSESPSHYYFHDNRGFPTSVTSERVDSEHWWYRPEYVIGKQASHKSRCDVLSLSPHLLWLMMQVR